MNFYTIIWCFTVFIKNAISLNVTIYYEALCPDSVHFITTQLFPSYLQLEKYLDIEFVPFGKAFLDNSNGNYLVSCQHGPSECRGNKYQACLLSQNKGQKNDLGVVNCIMSQRNPSIVNGIEMCASLLNYNLTALQECALSKEGDDLIISYGNKTMNLDPMLSFVPTIIYNDVFNQSNQDASLSDFAAVVCSKIEGIKPEVCKNRKYPRSFFQRLFNY